MASGQKPFPSPLTEALRHTFLVFTYSTLRLSRTSSTGASGGHVFAFPGHDGCSCFLFLLSLVTTCLSQLNCFMYTKFLSTPTEKVWVRDCTSHLTDDRVPQPAAEEPVPSKGSEQEVGGSSRDYYFRVISRMGWYPAQGRAAAICGEPVSLQAMAPSLSLRNSHDVINLSLMVPEGISKRELLFKFNLCADVTTVGTCISMSFCSAHSNTGGYKVPNTETLAYLPK